MNYLFYFKICHCVHSLFSELSFVLHKVSQFWSKPDPSLHCFTQFHILNVAFGQYSHFIWYIIKQKHHRLALSQVPENETYMCVQTLLALVNLGQNDFGKLSNCDFIYQYCDCDLICDFFKALYILYNSTKTSNKSVYSVQCWARYFKK